MLIERTFRTTQISIPQQLTKRLAELGYVQYSQRSGNVRTETTNPGRFTIMFEHTLTLSIPSLEHEILVDMIITEFAEIVH